MVVFTLGVQALMANGTPYTCFHVLLSGRQRSLDKRFGPRIFVYSSKTELMTVLPDDLPIFDSPGRVRKLLRSYDWSGFPAGLPNEWPSLVQANIRMLLRSDSPMAFLWGKDLRYFYNDAYLEVLGAKHPSALAAPFWDSWTEIVPMLSPIIDRAVSGEIISGENMELRIHRHGQVETAYFTFSLFPLLDDHGEFLGLLNPTLETTEQVRKNQLGEFQLKLSDRFHPFDNPDEMIAAACKILGQRLDAARVGYVEVDEGGETLRMKPDWTNGALESMTGRALQFSDFGPLIAEVLRTGHILAVADIESDPRSAPYAAAYAAVGVRAFLAIPLLNEGKLRVILQIHQPQARAWTNHDIALAEEMVKRTWIAAQYAHEAARRMRCTVNSGHVRFKQPAAVC
jgi:hypothetical protein